MPSKINAQKRRKEKVECIFVMSEEVSQTLNIELTAYLKQNENKRNTCQNRKAFNIYIPVWKTYQEK